MFAYLFTPITQTLLQILKTSYQFKAAVEQNNVNMAIFATTFRLVQHQKRQTLIFF
jgi:hypothetical protein